MYEPYNRGTFIHNDVYTLIDKVNGIVKFYDIHEQFIEELTMLDGQGHISLYRAIANRANIYCLIIDNVGRYHLNREAFINIVNLNRV